MDAEALLELALRRSEEASDERRGPRGTGSIAAARRALGKTKQKRRQTRQELRDRAHFATHNRYTAVKADDELHQQHQQQSRAHAAA